MKTTTLIALATKHAKFTDALLNESNEEECETLQAHLRGIEAQAVAAGVIDSLHALSVDFRDGSLIPPLS